jgi:type VI secretion system lysozyme-related protein
MAKREIERTVQPSVLDRLTDDDPRSPADPRISYLESLRQFKGAVQRDLEWLLNTRRTPTPAPEEMTELARSVYNYGVPDITSLSSDSPAARAQLLRDVESTLAIFEPRLENVQISMVEQDGEARRRELRFVVEATLRLDPTPEQVVFDTVLHFSSGQIEVNNASVATAGSAHA